MERESYDYLAKFFNLPQKSRQDGIIGHWTEDIDKNAHVYYIIDGTEIKKFIMCRFDEFNFSNQDGIQYIVQDGNNMADCWLEDGDLLFTDYKEACDYIKERYGSKKDKYKK